MKLMASAKVEKLSCHIMAINYICIIATVASVGHS